MGSRNSCLASGGLRSSLPTKEVSLTLREGPYRPVFSHLLGVSEVSACWIIMVPVLLLLCHKAEHLGVSTFQIF